MGWFEKLTDVVWGTSYSKEKEVKEEKKEEKPKEKIVYLKRIEK